MKGGYVHRPIRIDGIFLEPDRYVDLRSDTLTAPTPEMRRAMAEAEVGDDVLGEDPTINAPLIVLGASLIASRHQKINAPALQERVAQLLGKEASIFLPSGTMSNLIAVLSHCERRGDKVLAGDESHILLHEDDGPSMLGVPIHTMPLNPDGTFDLDEMEEKLQSLVCIENTFNGCVLPLEFIDEVGSRLARQNIPLHMDGARLFNAAVYLNVPASRIVERCTSVSICLSKGLGAPVGSMLAGTREFIHRAHSWRHLLGGALRQSGVLAAPARLAVDSGVDRLADDHRRMFKIASAIAAMQSPCVTVDLKLVHTNMAFLNIHPKSGTAREFADRIGTVTQEEKQALGKSVGIQCYDLSAQTVRFVTYNAVTDEDVDDVCDKLRYVIGSMDQRWKLCAEMAS